MTGALMGRALALPPEPEDDPVNALLDAFEGTVTAIAGMGHELQLRQRLKRLLPEPDDPPALAGPAGTGTRSAHDRETIDHVLALSQVVTGLREALARVRAPAAKTQIARALDIAQAEFEAARISFLPPTPTADLYLPEIATPPATASPAAAYGRAAAAPAQPQPHSGARAVGAAVASEQTRRKIP